MPRVKRGTSHVKKKNKLLSRTKGYMWGRKNLIKRAKEAVVKAGVHAYNDRKKKKRTMRGLWQIRIGAFAKIHGTSYSKLIDIFKKRKIEIDRKILADLAINNKKILAKIAGFKE
jgi:large subunit ribosomal protein L20